jgi:hypothetical protein
VRVKQVERVAKRLVVPRVLQPHGYRCSFVLHTV